MLSILYAMNKITKMKKKCDDKETNEFENGENEFEDIESEVESADSGGEMSSHDLGINLE